MCRSFCLLTMRAFGVLAMASLVGAPSLLAQGGTIAGRVTDAGTGEPLPSAQVFIQDLDVGALTQANGRYILLNVPAGTRTVTVQRIGFRDPTETVSVGAGQTVALDFLVSEHGRTGRCGGHSGSTDHTDRRGRWERHSRGEDD